MKSGKYLRNTVRRARGRRLTRVIRYNLVATYKGCLSLGSLARMCNAQAIVITSEK